MTIEFPCHSRHLGITPIFKSKEAGKQPLGPHRTSGRLYASQPFQFLHQSKVEITTLPHSVICKIKYIKCFGKWESLYKHNIPF